eukprot:c21259_g1_i2 orf=371-613(-)
MWGVVTPTHLQTSPRENAKPTSETRQRTSPGDCHSTILLTCLPKTLKVVNQVCPNARENLYHLHQDTSQNLGTVAIPNVP